LKLSLNIAVSLSDVPWLVFRQINFFFKINGAFTNAFSDLGINLEWDSPFDCVLIFAYFQNIRFLKRFNDCLDLELLGWS
jgi:hypothetical protein